MNGSRGTVQHAAIVATPAGTTEIVYAPNGAFEGARRSGLRWLLGRDDGSSLRDRRTRRGMAPDLMNDLRRLPDDLECAS